MLQRVEEAGPGIAACRLPTRDDGAGRLVEPSVDLGVEAETGQSALHVATLSLVESYLIFGFLSCLVDNVAGSADANRLRSVMLGPASATFALTRIPRTDNARMKTRNGLSSLNLSLLMISLCEPLSIQIHRPETRNPAASKSKVYSGFVTGQPLSGSLVPYRASNVALNCSETGRHEKRHGEDTSSARRPLWAALIPGCSARLPFRPSGRMFQDRHKGERHEQGGSRQPQARW